MTSSTARGRRRRADSPQVELDRVLSLSRYTPEIVRFADAVWKKLRSGFPGGFQLVHDNYPALVVGFGPTDKPSSVPSSGGSLVIESVAAKKRSRRPRG